METGPRRLLLCWIYILSVAGANGEQVECAAVYEKDYFREKKWDVARIRRKRHVDERWTSGSRPTDVHSPNARLDRRIGLDATLSRVS